MSDFKAKKCTEFDLGWASAPDPAGGAYSVPPDTLAGFKGAASRQVGGRERNREREGRGMGRDGTRRGGWEGDKGKGWTSAKRKTTVAPLVFRFS